MTEQVKTRARVLLSEHRRVMGLAWGLWMTALLPVLLAAVLVWKSVLPAALMFPAAGAVSLSLFAVGSCGFERVCQHLSVGKDASLETFFWAFSPLFAWRAAASFWLSVLLQMLLLVLCLLPAVAMGTLCSVALQRGLPVLSAAFLAAGTLALTLASLIAFRWLHLLFIPRRSFLLRGDSVWQSIAHCLALPLFRQKVQRRLAHSFFWLFCLCLLVVPAPFVWCYYRQSCILTAPNS